MKISQAFHKKLRRSARRAADLFHGFLRSYYLKPVMALILSICLLLTAVPFIMGRLHSHIEKPTKDISPSPSFDTVEPPDTATVYRTETGMIETVDFEKYVKGVVSCEMPSSFHKEALKAQAVAARTYSAARIISASEGKNPDAHPAAPLCDTTHCQVYKNENDLKNIKGEKWMKKDWRKISSAVDDTAGQLLYYKGELVRQALFHSSSGGMTENSEDVFASAVPYLVSVESPYEEEATHQNEKKAFSISQFTSAIRTSYPSEAFGQITADSIRITERSDGNRVRNMRIGSGNLTGRQVREALGLSSANFTIDVSGDTITFTSNGSGHGVGMSQYGADGMAKNGYDYKKILSHYYSGTELY